MAISMNESSEPASKRSKSGRSRSRKKSTPTVQKSEIEVPKVPRPPADSPEREAAIEEDSEGEIVEYPVWQPEPFDRPRNRKIEQKINKTSRNGNFIQEFDPTSMTGDELDSIFNDREDHCKRKNLTRSQRQLIHYIPAPGEEKYDKKYKIMVKCKT